MSERERAAIEAAFAYAGIPRDIHTEFDPDHMAKLRRAIAAYNAALQAGDGPVAYTSRSACPKCGSHEADFLTDECRPCPERVVSQDDYKAVKDAIFEELLRQAAERGEQPQGDGQTYRLIHSDRAGALALAVLTTHRPVPQDEGPMPDERREKYHQRIRDASEHQAQGARRAAETFIGGSASVPQEDCQHSLSITRDGGIGKRIVDCVKCSTVIGDVSDGYNAVLDLAEQAPAPEPQDEERVLSRLRHYDFGLSDEEAEAFTVGVEQGYRAALSTHPTAETTPAPGYWPGDVPGGVPGVTDKEETGPIGAGTPHARMKWFWERMRPHEKLVGELTGWSPISSTYRWEAAIADAFDALATEEKR